jgi:alpha-N-arabinofuranosidase
VTSLAASGATSDDYTLDPSTGEITFGDGVHGAIPASGATITASYVSGPHDGFEQFYRAMKRANPDIHVCSTDTSQNFIEAMGSTLPYDCLQDHPYVGAGDASPSQPIDTYETQVMGAPDTEAAAVQSLQSLLRQDAGRQVPLVLSEYGELINSTPDPATEPYYLDSLDEALVNASQLAAWIRLGVPVADRQLLTAEQPAPANVTQGLPGAAPYAVTGAIVTPGPQTIAEPTGLYLGLMRPLAGARLLPAQTSGNPQLTTAAGAPVGDLSVVAASASGGVDVLAINRSPADDVTTSLSVTSGVATGRAGGVATERAGGVATERAGGVATGRAGGVATGRAGGVATITTLDGPSALSDNTASAPGTVHTTTSAAPVRRGALQLTLPAHSISLVRIGGVVDGRFRVE